MSKKIVLVTSQTGGVGKSTLTCAMVDVARSCGIATAAYDTDTRPGRVGKLLRRYGERDGSGALALSQNPLTGVGYFDARDPKAREQLIALVDEDADLVVVDLPGGSLKDMADVVPGGLSGLTQLYREYGWEPWIVMVITTVRICSEEVVEALPRLKDSGANIVVAKNLGATGDHLSAPAELDANEFFLFNGDGGVLSSGAGRRLLRELGGQELLVPCIRARSHTYVDAHQLPFSTAAQRKDEDKQYRGDQRWIRSWLAGVDTALRDLGLLSDGFGDVEIIRPKAVAAV